MIHPSKRQRFNSVIFLVHSDLENRQHNHLPASLHPLPRSWLIPHTIENSDLKNLVIFHTFQMTYIASHSLRTRSPRQPPRSAEAYSRNPNVLKEDNHFHKGALRFLPAKLISLQDTCQYVSWNVNCADGGREEEGINRGEDNPQPALL